MFKHIKSSKSGAASFYIVAISTLVLVIIAVSFAAVIISELARTSNDDLAQSAYDSALAGVEDAKLAYYNYSQCKEGNGAGLDCDYIKSLVEGNEETDECNMVAHVLGRISTDEEKEVMIQETSTSSNNMLQAYTCTKLKVGLRDVRQTLTDAEPVKVAKVKLADSDDYKKLTRIKVSWGSSQSGIVADAAPDGSNPPAALGISIIQTANEFTLAQFDKTEGNTTNRGTVYLVPTTEELADTDEYKYRAPNGIISKTDGFLKSNDKTVKNVPFAVKENTGEGVEFPYSVIIDLPCPVGTADYGTDGCSARNNNTFIISSSRIGDQTTDVSIEFCTEDSNCQDSESEAGGAQTNRGTGVELKMQVEVDSTGRANDIYRRVATRLGADAKGAYDIGLFYAVQALGTGGNGGITKISDVTCEANFPNMGC